MGTNRHFYQSLERFDSFRPAMRAGRNVEGNGVWFVNGCDLLSKQF